MKRSRSDLLTVILKQLSTSIGDTNAASWNPLSEEIADCTVSLCHVNPVLKLLYKYNIIKIGYFLHFPASFYEHKYRIHASK